MLTRREFEVYMLIVERGLTSTDIAEDLGCGVENVRKHTKLIMKKLGFHHRVPMLVSYHKAEMNF